MKECKPVYNDDRWAEITSDDQIGCNLFVSHYKDMFVGKNVLHVGIGSSSMLIQFHHIFGRLDGITIMQSEIDKANLLRPKYGLEYRVYQIDKYNTTRDEGKLDALTNDYHLIVDNNLKQHGCCERHWDSYMAQILSKLVPGGILLTHTQGFAPHTNHVSALSIQELKIYGSEFDCKLVEVDDMKNHLGHYPVLLIKEE